MYLSIPHPRHRHFGNNPRNRDPLHPVCTPDLFHNLRPEHIGFPVDNKGPWQRRKDTHPSPRPLGTPFSDCTQTDTRKFHHTSCKWLEKSSPGRTDSLESCKAQEGQQFHHMGLEHKGRRSLHRSRDNRYPPRNKHPSKTKPHWKSHIFPWLPIPQHIPHRRCTLRCNSRWPLLPGNNRCPNPNPCNPRDRNREPLPNKCRLPVIWRIQRNQCRYFPCNPHPSHRLQTYNKES